MSKDDLKAYLQKKYHHKVGLITNALDSNNYPVREFRNDSNGKIRIVFFGRIEDVTKGCDKIPKIARKLKDRGIDFEWDFYG